MVITSPLIIATDTMEAAIMGVVTIGECTGGAAIMVEAMRTATMGAAIEAVVTEVGIDDCCGPVGFQAGS